MNARYPARPAGMWGVNRTHVIAALAATLGVMVGGVAVAAWDVSDDDAANRVYAPPAINIDRLAEEAARNQAAPITSGVSGADLISASGRGFVDVDSLEATISANAPLALDGGLSGGDRISAMGRGFVDVESLEAGYVIAEHEAAIEGAGIVGRGQVFSE